MDERADSWPMRISGSISFWKGNDAGQRRAERSCRCGETRRRDGRIGMGDVKEEDVKALVEKG